MATYKVPQDVEADDKLIGPFSFRQFIYLIVVAMAGALAWGLSQLFFPLVILPLPIILLFGTLALPLRKDQPMEIYLAAMISFYLKPRRRLWDGEGVETLIEITAPKTVEKHLTKELSQNEAEERLSYLANIVDSQGWAIRGVNGAQNTAMNQDVFLEAQSAVDVLDTTTSVAQNFDAMMAQRTERLREEARAQMTQPQPAPTPNPQPQTPGPQVQYNPYPTIQQAIVQPLDDPQHQATPSPSPQAQGLVIPDVTPYSAPSTSGSTPSADIINLANNNDVSIATIAHEAQRLQKKAEESEEVVISLR